MIQSMGFILICHFNHKKLCRTVRPSTSYGSLGPGVEEDDFDRLEYNPSDYIQEPEEQTSALSHFYKPATLAAGLLIISVAALSISQYSGIGFNLTPKSAAKLDEVVRPVFANLEDYEKEALFRTFVEDFDKKYKTDEYQTKLKTFDEFLLLCDARNMAEANNGGTAVHGVTMFADLQDVEYQKYMGYTASSATLNTISVSTVDAYTGSATSVDWTDVYTTSVKDQGYCTSSWAFAAVEQIESDAIRTLGITTSETLSTQQLVSCDSADGGCNGGDPTQAYEYAVEYGLVLETDYAYASTEGESGTCDSSKTDYKISVTEYYSLAGTDSTTVENNMINYVKSTGPLTVCVDASTWSSYTSGVVSVCTSNVNHCVQAVGVDTGNGFWKLRNSWSTSFGESGYIYLRTSENTCGITTLPTYTKPTMFGVTNAPTETPTAEPTAEPSSPPFDATPEPSGEPTPYPTYTEWDDDWYHDSSEEGNQAVKPKKSSKPKKSAKKSSSA